MPLGLLNDDPKLTFVLHVFTQMADSLSHRPIVNCITQLALVMYIRNEFYFSEVCRSVNYIRSHAKRMNPEGVHVNFTCDPM